MHVLCVFFAQIYVYLVSARSDGPDLCGSACFVWLVVDALFHLSLCVGVVGWGT